VAAGVWERSGGVDPFVLCAARRRGDSGERVTQLERSPAPGDGTRPASCSQFVKGRG